MGLSLPIFDGIVKIADKLIPDKDKLAELEAEVKRAQSALDQLLLTTTTTPWVDGLVKILYATERFIRPVGSFLMLLFAAYADTHGIKLSPEIEYVLYGAFPAWGVSRHSLQKEKIKKGSH